AAPLCSTTADALLLKTQGEKEITATAAATKRRNDAMVKLVTAQREYEQRVKAEEIKQQAQIEAARKQAAGFLAAAEAEEKSAEALAVKRAYDYASKKNTVEKSLVGHAKMVISGENVEQLIRQLIQDTA
ncbi:hypothetical protein LEN26_009588, partial [Aphanomyces euteiches]